MSDIQSNVEGLELYSDNYPFRLSLKIKNFENESEYKKFIKNCEKLIRNSMEYRLWREYIKDVLGIQECVITKETNEEVTVEVHHHVPTLFMLLKSLINKRIEENKEFSSFDICIDAIELHFKNKIGYVTLLSSMHEKLHNGYLTIPISLVKGDYQYFIANYSRYLDAEDLDSINANLAMTESNCTWARDNYPEAVSAGL